MIKKFNEQFDYAKILAGRRQEMIMIVSDSTLETEMRKKKVNETREESYLNTENPLALVKRNGLHRM